MNGKVRLEVLGTRGARAALTHDCGTRESSPCSKRSRRPRVRSLSLPCRPREFRCLAHAGDGRHVFGPGRRSRSECPPYISGPRCVPFRMYSAPTPFGPENLCAEIESRSHAQLLHVDGNFSGGLHGVGMKRDSLFGCDFADLLDGLDRSRFVICEHDCDQDGLGTNRSPDVFQIHEPVAVHRENREIDAALGQRPARIEYGDVLYGGRNHVPGFAGGRRHGAENRVVARLRASAGEHDVRGARAQQSRNRGTSLLHGFPRVLAECMDRAGIAVFLGEVRHHGRQNFRRQRSSRVVVEVNALHVKFF